MNRILFILPSFHTGGTLSSFLSIYNRYSNKCVINVYALSHQGDKLSLPSECILKKDIILHLYTGHFKEFNFFERILALGIKFIKKICSILNNDFEHVLYKNSYSKIKNASDIVVGFQEGAATKFASICTGMRKYAWVHCDYSKYCSTPKEFNIYKSFDRIICVSAFTSNVFKEFYPELLNRVLSINNILNIDTIISKSHCEIDDTRFKTDEFVIISVGRISSVKRFDQIPRIANEVISKGYSIKWYILGPNYNDPYFISMIRNIEMYNLSDIVVYLGNKLNPYPYYRASNLLVTLSSSEACPMIFNESKILGLPIVTTNFGSSYEFVTPNDGLIAPIDKLSEAIIEFMDNKELYDKCRRNNINPDSININIEKQLDTLFL